MYTTTEPLFEEDPGLIKIDSSRRPLTSLQAYEEDHQSSCTIFEQINYPQLILGDEVKNEQGTQTSMEELYIERVMERARELSENLERQRL